MKKKKLIKKISMVNFSPSILGDYDDYIEKHELGKCLCLSVVSYAPAALFYFIRSLHKLRVS